MSVECKWFYNFHHSTSSAIKPNVKPSKSAETHFRFEINSEIWFQGTLGICMWNVSITSPHFNLFNQHKNPKNPYFSTKKLPTSGLLSTHFRFGLNSAAAVCMDMSTSRCRPDTRNISRLSPCMTTYVHDLTL